VIDSSSHPKSTLPIEILHRAENAAGDREIAKWMEKESKKLGEAIY
jgi:hypothetical protein